MSQPNFHNVPKGAGSPQELTASTKKPYKVVLESVTQGRKKLRTTVSYQHHAPPGYTFVPVGAPDLTEYCKELSRKRGLTVYIVSTGPQTKAHKNPNNISHHIHRTGHHFKNRVVDVACEILGYTTAGPLAIARRLDSQTQRRSNSSRDATPDHERKKVAWAIKDLFPKIPDEDQEAIVARAFEEGTTRVGNANLPLARRVQLAVVAHIRHTKTDYDSILKATNWQNARQKVEQACLEQIVKWRGEDDNGEEEELEEMFREVIVLDDEDDEDTGGDESENTNPPSRDSSVEIISEEKFDRRTDDRPRHHTQIPYHLEPDQLQPHNARDIIHVQPRKALINPPVLRQRFRQRLNEARARVGLADRARSDVGAPNAPARHGASFARSEQNPFSSNQQHYPHIAANGSEFGRKSQQQDARSIAVHPSIEASNERRPMREQRGIPVSPYNQVPSLVTPEHYRTYDHHVPQRGTDLEIPLHVREYQTTSTSHFRQPPLQLHAPYDANVATRTSKRKSPLEMNTEYPPSNRLDQPKSTKRVRLYDSDVVTNPHVMRASGNWSHGDPVPATGQRGFYDEAGVSGLTSDTSRDYGGYIGRNVRQSHDPSLIRYDQRHETMQQRVQREEGQVRSDPAALEPYPVNIHTGINRLALAPNELQENFAHIPGRNDEQDGRFHSNRVFTRTNANQSRSNETDHYRSFDPRTSNGQMAAMTPQSREPFLYGQREPIVYSGWPAQQGHQADTRYPPPRY